MGAQGIIKEAMGRLVPVYRDLRMIGNIDPLIQIHDDIVWEMDERLVDIAIPEIRKVMKTSAPLDFILPLDIDFKVGRKWGSMVKVK